MKYYSETLNKMFDSQEELEQAEGKKQMEQAEAAKKLKAKQLEISKDKKELSQAIDKADEELTKAYSDYEEALTSAKELIEAATIQARDLIKPTKQAVQKAQKDKYKAISEFNSKYGVYTKYYTGEKVKDELKRFSYLFDNLFGYINFL